MALYRLSFRFGKSSLSTGIQRPIFPSNPFSTAHIKHSTHEEANLVPAEKKYGVTAADINVEEWRNKSMNEVLELGKQAGCDAHEMYWLEVMKTRCDKYPQRHWSELHAWSGYHQHNSGDMYGVYDPHGGRADLMDAPIGGRKIYREGEPMLYIPLRPYYMPWEMDDKMVALKEKEQLHWGFLSPDEARVLYRMHFRRTLYETQKDTHGDEMLTMLIALLIGLGTVLVFVEIDMRVVGGKFPARHTRDFKDWNTMVSIRNRNDIITGMSAIYDFEKDQFIPKKEYSWWTGRKGRHPYILYPDEPEFQRYHNPLWHNDFRHNYQQAAEEGLIPKEDLNEVFGLD